MPPSSRFDICPPLSGGNTYFAGGNVYFEGGAGDDVIVIGGPSSPSEGYSESGAGGLGDDTLIMSSSMPSSDFVWFMGDIRAEGNEGADTFRIEMQDREFDWREVQEPTLPGPGSLNFDAFTISDFEPGVDELIIDADAVTEGGVLAAGVLSEEVDGSGNENTVLTFTYESSQQETTRFRVTLFNSSITWDDVTFEGDQRPVLTVA